MNCNNMGHLGNGCKDSLRHIEQIALNKGAIDCLNGRVYRAESDIKERYTKAELDRMLACKMDRCSSGKLPHQHGNGKPNICDCYTKEELDLLLAEIACKCDTYSKEELDDLLAKVACTCDCYSKDEVDSLLENKANIVTDYDWYRLPLINGTYREFSDEDDNPHYSIDEYKNVRLKGYVILENDTGGGIPPLLDFAVLPVGFRPKVNTNIPIAINITLDEGNYSDVFSLFIRKTGEMFLSESYYTSPFVKGGIRLDNVSFWAGSAQ